MFFVIAHRFYCPHSRMPRMSSFSRFCQRRPLLLGSALLSRTQQSPGLLLPASTPLRAVRSRSSFRASPNSIPKKQDHPWVVLFFWSGRRGSNSLPRPWQGRALPDELRPQTAPLLRHLGASGRSRTNDTRIFSPLLYQLSYRGIWRPRRGSNPRPPA